MTMHQHNDAESYHLMTCPARRLNWLNWAMIVIVVLLLISALPVVAEQIAVNIRDSTVVGIAMSAIGAALLQLSTPRIDPQGKQLIVPDRGVFLNRFLPNAGWLGLVGGFIVQLIGR